MRFQHAGDNAAYVVRATENPVAGKDTPPKGLKARFLGRDRIFDSEATQLEEGWTGAERLQVERHLLIHRDFGRRQSRGAGGLYLAPGQDVPSEHADLNVDPDAMHEAAAQVKLAESHFRCAYVWTTTEGIKQCPKAVEPDSQYCTQHTTELADLPADPLAELTS